MAENLPSVSIPLSGPIQQTTNLLYLSYFSQKIGSEISCKLSIAWILKAEFLGKH